MHLLVIKSFLCGKSNFLRIVVIFFNLGNNGVKHPMDDPHSQYLCRERTISHFHIFFEAFHLRVESRERNSADKKFYWL
jgi:hypothetical protein